MIRDKINAIISEVNENLAEREELVHTIALALLTRKNLFVLGEPGQAKSQAIDSFRSHINGAKQFEILMSKGIDQEQLFGRLDLASIIPGHISNSVLKNDEGYMNYLELLGRLVEDSAADTQKDDFLNAASELRQKMEEYRKNLAELKGNRPEILTEGKIPDSHICFLDEIFKANDGVLNSLLKALNERVYTNEGVTVNIPVVSFFSASNEIPNFSNPEEKSLRALYDRFDFKVCTRYVDEKSNRMRILKQKQDGYSGGNHTEITLNELEQAQNEVRRVQVPESINEIMDNILCDLRGKGIPVTDRKYFNFTPIVQAHAYLAGRDTVIPEDLLSLVNYLWDKPTEYASVEETIKNLSENPIREMLDDLMVQALNLYSDFENTSNKVQGLIVLRNNLLDVYGIIERKKDELSEDDVAHVAIDSTLESIEELSKKAHQQTNYTYVPLHELKQISVAANKI